MINQCYEYEAAHTIQDVLSCNGDLNIALVADSHLDNSVPATIENISAVDQAVHFDCCVHLGDFLAGEIGRRYAKLLLRQQLALFRPTVSSGRFFPVQGNHDDAAGRIPRGSGRRPSAFWTRSRVSAVLHRSHITM